MKLPNQFVVKESSLLKNNFCTENPVPLKY